VLEAHHRCAFGMRLETVDDGFDERRRQRRDEARLRVKAERARIGSSNGLTRLSTPCRNG
jgi:hypothetical protein